MCVLSNKSPQLVFFANAMSLLTTKTAEVPLTQKRTNTTLRSLYQSCVFAKVPKKCHQNPLQRCFSKSTYKVLDLKSTDLPLFKSSSKVVLAESVDRLVLKSTFQVLLLQKHLESAYGSPVLNKSVQARNQQIYPRSEFWN